MPKHILLLGRYGNAALACLFAIILLVGLTRGFGMVALGVVGLALAAFNIYVFEKAARLLGEEELLKAELRKLDLRRQIGEAYEALPRPGASP